MALYKEIKQADGVTTKYHRILYLTQTINSHNSIAVVSYVDEESRENDIPSESGSIPYRKAVTYECDYDEDMTVEKAYEWLKKQPAFVGAEDI